jgi:hypothetical protein
MRSRRRKVLALTWVVTLAVAVACGGYAVGVSRGEDLAAARADGTTAGAAAGKRAGAAAGARDGDRAGARAAYRAAWRAAARRAYRATLEGGHPPARVRPPACTGAAAEAGRCAPD